MNAAEALPATAASAPARTAVRLGDEVLSYRALDRASARIAGLLIERGLQDGRHVALALPNVPAFAQAYYGVLRAGCVAVTLPALPDARVLRPLLRAAGAPLLIAWHALAEAVDASATGSGVDCVFVAPRELPRLLSGVAPLAAVRPRADDDVATMAAGKGAVPRSHGWLRERALAAIGEAGLGGDGVVACEAPLWDPAAQAGVLHAAVSAGATVALDRRPVLSGAS
ncbi:MAG TPA: AMP-binding protein [Solirubrobacteraceae bacterium]|nr:AMP-binding protein [Solirubrobacteraceae bacterium]